MENITGVIVTLGIGVITIAAIFQLSKGKAPLVTATQSVANNTLSSIFK